MKVNKMCSREYREEDCNQKKRQAVIKELIGLLLWSIGYLIKLYYKWFILYILIIIAMLTILFKFKGG